MSGPWRLVTKYNVRTLKYNIRTLETGDEVQCQDPKIQCQDPGDWGCQDAQNKGEKMVKTNNIYWAFPEASVRKPCLAKSQGLGAIHSAHTSADDPICRPNLRVEMPRPSYHRHRHRHAVRWVLMDDEFALEAYRFLAVKRISRMRLPWVEQRRFLCGQLLSAWSQLLLGLLVVLVSYRLSSSSFIALWWLRSATGALVFPRYMVDKTAGWCTRLHAVAWHCVSSWLSLVILELLLFCCAPKRVKRCGLQFGRTFFVPPRPGPVDYACGIGPFSSHLASHTQSRRCLREQNACRTGVYCSLLSINIRKRKATKNTKISSASLSRSHKQTEGGGQKKNEYIGHCVSSTSLDKKERFLSGEACGPVFCIAKRQTKGCWDHITR